MTPHPRPSAYSKAERGPTGTIRQVDPSLMSAVGNPATNPGVSVGTNWVLGMIPTDEEEPKKSFLHRDPLHIKPAVPSPKVFDPIPPFPHQGSKSGEGELAIGDPKGSGGVSTAPVMDIPGGSLPERSFFRQKAQTGGFYPGSGGAY